MIPSLRVVRPFARRAALVGALCAVIPMSALAQQAQPLEPPPDSPFTLHAVLNMRISELRFNVAPSLSLDVDGSGTNALEEPGAQEGSCDFQPDLTYRNVRIHLEIVDQRVRLTCVIDAAVDEPPSPSGGEP